MRLFRLAPCSGESLAMPKPIPFAAASDNGDLPSKKTHGTLSVLSWNATAPKGGRITGHFSGAAERALLRMGKIKLFDRILGR